MKIGILGTGGIAHKLTMTFKQMKEVECYAIASRTLEKAELFKTEFGFKKAYGSYEELVQDPEVELVYIATPHSEHYANMMMALKYKKPILCEKAFTANAEQAKEIMAESEAKHVFVTEAIWTRYMPSRKILSDIISAGYIGKPYMISANLCYPIKSHDRLTNPSLAGGSLLDVGIYPLNFAMMLFPDDPIDVYASCTYAETGVDETDVYLLKYPDGKMATLYASMNGPSDRSGFVYGDKGYLQVININDTEKIDAFDKEHHLILEKTIPVHSFSGYEYEIYESINAIEASKIECSSMPHKETIRMMELFDKIRYQMKIKYPFES